jgi:hypothetical protein
MDYRDKAIIRDILYVGLVAILAFMLGCVVGAVVDRNRDAGINTDLKPKEEQAAQTDETWIPTLYVQATKGTIIDPLLLRAIAVVESGEVDSAIGDEGLSHGRFQLYSVYHKERVQKYGDFNPFNPDQAGRVAARYLEECYLATDDLTLAVAAYRQGIGGVRKNGIQGNYVKRVMTIYFSFYVDPSHE